MEDGYYQEKGFRPDWTSWADVPRWQRRELPPNLRSPVSLCVEELETACPYYFLLRDLWHPRYRRPGTLPSEYLPGSKARYIPDRQGTAGRAARAGRGSQDIIDTYYDVSAIKRKLKHAHPDPDEDTPPPSQTAHPRAHRYSTSPPLKRHRPFDSSYIPLHLPSSFFDGPDAKPGFEYHDPIKARKVLELFEGARAAEPKVNRLWKGTEKFVADHKLADEHVMRHTNLRCFAAAFCHPKWSQK